MASTLRAAFLREPSNSVFLTELWLRLCCAVFFVVINKLLIKVLHKNFAVWQLYETKLGFKLSFATFSWAFLTKHIVASL